MDFDEINVELEEDNGDSIKETSQADEFFNDDDILDDDMWVSKDQADQQ